MGEQAAKIGKKLEGFGVNFFANLGWTELTQDKEIKCTRSSHKKKTHGIDLLCKFTNPYIAGNQGIVVECKNRQMGSITRATIEEWVKELINNIECAQSAPELVDVDLRNTTLNTGLLLIHANDKFDQQKFYDHLSKIAFPNRRNPINIFIAANDRIAQWTSLFAKVKTSYNNGFSFIYPSINESNKISQKSLTINALYSKYLLGCSTYNIQKDIAGNTYQEPHTQNMLFFFDEITVNNFRYAFNAYRSSNFRGYVIEQPIKSGSELIVNMSYKRKLPGKNKLIQDETRYIHIAIRKNGESEVSIDIRQPSSYDAQKALELLQAMTDSSEESEVSLAHINLELLTDKNKVGFYDRLSAHGFRDWRLKTVVGITVKKATSSEDDIEEEDSENDESTSGTLAGISQAVLNGSGLRSNEFVQNSIQQGYYISSMKYRYVCTQEAGEFVVAINSKGENLRVDIEKSFSDDDGKLYVQPFPKELQDEIIRAFQKAANTIFYSLIEEQKQVSVNNAALPG